MRALFLLVLFAFLKAVSVNGDKGSLTISSPCDGHLTHKLPLNHSFERSDIILSGKCLNGVIFTVMSLGAGTIKGSVISSSDGTLHISDGNPIYTVATESRFEFLYRMIDTRVKNAPYKISLMKYVYSASSPLNKLQTVMVREHTSEDCKFPQINIDDSKLCVLHLLLKKYSQNSSGSPNSKVEAIHLAELQNSASCYNNPVMCTSELHVNKHTSEEDLIDNFSCLFSESAKCVPVETGTQTETVNKVDAETQTPPVIITQTSTTANTLSKKELKKLEKEEKDRLRKQKKLLLQQEKERKKLEKQKQKEEKKALKEANKKSVSDERKKKEEARLLKQQEKQKKKEEARLLKQQEKEKQRLSREEKQKQRLLDAEEKKKQKLLKKQEKERLRLQKQKEKEEQKLREQKEKADKNAAKAIEKSNKEDSSSSSCSSNKKTKSKATQTDVPTNVVLASVQTQTEDVSDVETNAEDVSDVETNTEDVFVNEDIKIVDEDPKDDLPEATEEEQSNVEVVSISPSLTPIESSPSSTTTTTTAPRSSKQIRYQEPSGVKYTIGPFASKVVHPTRHSSQAVQNLQSGSFVENTNGNGFVVESKNLGQSGSSEPSSSLEEILEDVSKNNLITIIRDE